MNDLLKKSFFCFYIFIYTFSYISFIQIDILLTFGSLVAYVQMYRPKGLLNRDVLTLLHKIIKVVKVGKAHNNMNNGSILCPSNHDCVTVSQHAQ